MLRICSASQRHHLTTSCSRRGNGASGSSLQPPPCWRPATALQGLQAAKCGLNECSVAAHPRRGGPGGVPASPAMRHPLLACSSVCASHTPTAVCFHMSSYVMSDGPPLSIVYHYSCNLQHPCGWDAQQRCPAAMPSWDQFSWSTLKQSGVLRNRLVAKGAARHDPQPGVLAPSAAEPARALSA